MNGAFLNVSKTAACVFFLRCFNVLTTFFKIRIVVFFSQFTLAAVHLYICFFLKLKHALDKNKNVRVRFILILV